MKTWKKILAFTTITGVALGGLAYFAKKKSIEEDFSEEFDEAFDTFDDEIKKPEETSDDSADRNYVPIDLETPAKEEAATDEKSKTEKKAEADSTTTKEEAKA